MTEPGSAQDAPTPRGTPAPPTRTVLIVGAIALAVVGGLVGGLLVRATTSASGNEPASVCPATGVAEQVLPSVVKITARGATSGGGTGSGEIIRTGGYILTNDHVISVAANGGKLSVLYNDGRTSEATIVGRDPVTDLAVIKAVDKAEDRPLIRIGSSASLRVGQPVVALGAPLGLYGTVTSGIVSALGRYVPIPRGGGKVAHLVDAIQTDASINPGNSGGALVDCAGDLVGVNSAISTVPNAEGIGGGGNVGIGFAIPVDLAKPFADQLIETGRVSHPVIGMEVQTLPAAVAARSGTPAGLFVVGVVPGGPAASAGLRAGDVITSVDGAPAARAEQLTVLTLTRTAGDTVPITYSRDGVATDTEITLAAPE